MENGGGEDAQGEDRRGRARALAVSALSRHGGVRLLSCRAHVRQGWGGDIVRGSALVREATTLLQLLRAAR